MDSDRFSLRWLYGCSREHKRCAAPTFFYCCVKVWTSRAGPPVCDLNQLSCYQWDGAITQRSSLNPEGGTNMKVQNKLQSAEEEAIGGSGGGMLVRVTDITVSFYTALMRKLHSRDSDPQVCLQTCHPKYLWGVKPMTTFVAAVASDSKS